ncbi:Glutaredoxin [Quillaja saponaria]|uniref:Glutaredoxin n=1 Tax=Quillaja saponaria TaxID=32244 RepID=A0AAD7Q4N3_QUISA|nr:Glutaredoxin [Quillaja saponaria]
MKAMKGKLLKKLKSIRPIGYLKQDRVLQVNASDRYAESVTNNSTFNVLNQILCNENELKKIDRSTVKLLDPDIIDVSELMKDLEDEEMEVFEDDRDNKENIGPPIKPKKLDGLKNLSPTSIKTEYPSKQSSILETPRNSESRANDHHRQDPLSEIDTVSFRLPDLNSSSLFDPNLLSVFEQVVEEHIRMTQAESKARDEETIFKENEQEPPLKIRRVEEDSYPLLVFEEKCPPGGSDSVILYTTTLGGIRKTLEDCHSIRFLLESFRVKFFERDISMHMEFKEELWRTLDRKALPPRLFVKGRYIGGAEEVLGLHEQEKLRPLFEGVPIDRSNGPCEGCGGIRFVLCFNCNGSHKVIAENGDSNQCPNCNENGLIVCPSCC